MYRCKTSIDRLARRNIAKPSEGQNEYQQLI